MIGYLLSLHAIILWERGPGRKRFLPGLFMQFRFEIVSNGVRSPCTFGGAKFDREAAFKSIIGAGRQSENAVVAEEKNAKKNSDRVQRAYYLDRDIDKALRRMALEEGKNLTESVNDALRAGLTKYL